MSRSKLPLHLACFVGVSAIAIPELARAQDPNTGGGDDSTPAPQTPTDTGPTPGGTQVFVPGYPAPGTDVNGHLPSSSRASNDISKSTDGFDLLPKDNAPTVRGSASGSYVVEGQYVPESHSVRRGDTLWDISARYFNNPYNWPRVWAYNPQILNPHWIYPGDRVKLRDASPPTLGNIGMSSRRASVPPGTIFLRDVGWVDDKTDDNWGGVIGSPDDQLLLSDNDDVYIELGDDHDVQLGQLLTVWKPLRNVGSGDARGLLVSIRGTVRVDRYNPDTHMVRGKIIESLDVIERGARVGPVGRRFNVIPPIVSDRDIQARILASIYPLQMYGQHQVVFIDKGEKEGVKAGMRFFAIRRGDGWQKSLRHSGALTTSRVLMEDDRVNEIEATPFPSSDSKLPDETYAELRVIRVREHTAMVVVTASTSEIERNAFLYAKKDY